MPFPAAPSLRSLLACGIAAAVVSVSQPAVPVFAQSVPQASERGSFWGRPAPQQRDEMQERDAARLYADARADLDAGQVAAAQRRLEVLVARYPTSPLADVARRDLQRIYLTALGTGTPPPAAPIAPPAAQRATPVAPVAIQPMAPAAGPAPATPPPSGLHDASDDFRQVAGDRIFFADSSIDLGGRAKTALEAQAAWLIRYPGIAIVVEGHSDDHGSRDFNRQMSEKRAESVKMRLADLGVTADRITVAAFGRDRPVADCAEAHCTAHNRRVVTVIARVPAGLGFEPSRTVGPAGVPIR